ncbi:hypothetical protein [Actinacidiphila oryziradicis]|uniref:hypothetical protein n=1 Tax=Actinacidiphila oryziradicis TaxID=2571141 RepID=UPI00145E8B7C|nr:hypothetical protein [Actinacidiphila oryziradicis]
MPELTGIPGVHPRELATMAPSIAAHLGGDGRTRQEAKELGAPFALTKRPSPVEGP